MRIDRYNNEPLKTVCKKFDAAGWAYVEGEGCTAYLSPDNRRIVVMLTYMDAAGIERILDCYKYDGIFSLDWFLSFR